MDPPGRFGCRTPGIRGNSDMYRCRELLCIVVWICLAGPLEGSSQTSNSHGAEETPNHNNRDNQNLESQLGVADSTSEHSATDSRERAEEEEDSLLSDRAIMATESIARFTFWQAVIGIGGLVFLGLTLVGSICASIITQKTARAQLRAYLWADPPGDSINSQSGKIKINTIIENSGITPAYSVQIWPHIFIEDLPVKKDTLSRKDEKLSSPFIIPGKGTHDISDLREEPAIHYVWEDYLKRKKQFFFAAEIRYRDVFRKLRRP